MGKQSLGKKRILVENKGTNRIVDYRKIFERDKTPMSNTLETHIRWLLFQLSRFLYRLVFTLTTE